jgi:PKHD-type hydroxylase
VLLAIPGVLSAEQVAQVRSALDAAEWQDGRVTAGQQSALAKDNQQLPEDSSAARELGNLVLGALERSALFMSAALPARVFPPLFNRYSSGQSFGTHIDNAIRQVRGTSFRVRTDLSATLFLSAAEEYDGGELVVDDTFGTHRVKLPAGHLVLYPASSLHHVRPITRGTRIASFFWIQSMVRDDAERRMLLDLDSSIQQLSAAAPNHAALVQLTGLYHNLLRRWADP